MSLIGSTACVTFSYIFPGLISGRNGEGLFARAGGYAVVGMAGIIAIITIVNTLSGHVEL